ncbi:MAG TPA: hypothetical protein VNO14_15605, partial [Blastocatellia bacterium]|nr:hypothetical protein [Blastocatellia bacterium]
VVHGAGGNINIPLGGRSDSTPAAPAAAPSTPTINRKAEELLADYQRLIGVRLSSAGVEFEAGSRAGDPEIELLFAIDNFANAARLYEGLSSSLRTQNSLRSATLALAKEARRLDRVVTTTSSPTARQIERRWDSIRQDILKLMQVYNIDSSEIED